jgi:peptide/nickel transport system permease protein
VTIPPFATFALRRTGQAVVVLLLVYILTFIIVNVIPGDAVSSRLSSPESGLSPEDVKEIIAYYGLDQPLVVQLWDSLTRALTGDLGVSLTSRIPVTETIGEALPSTLALAGTALLIAVPLAGLIALGTQVVPERYGQGVIRAFPSLFLSVPNFIIGLVLIQVFAFSLGVFQIIEPESLIGTILAATALAVPVSAQLAEILIANLDKQAAQEFVTVARARGLSQRRLFFRHLLKPGALPAVTMLALVVGELLGGSVITEIVFGRSGIGAVIERSAAAQDFPVLLAVVTLSAGVFVIANLLADLAYPLLDPRVESFVRSAGKAPAQPTEVVPS